MTITALIAQCQAFASAQEYLWFRMSYVNLGGAGQWVVFFESLAGPVGSSFSDSDLTAALSKLVATIVSKLQP